MKKIITIINNNIVLFYVLVFLFAFFGFSKYVLSENYIYYWDNKEYFVAYVNYFKLLHTDTFAFLSSFAHSIYFSKYNVSPTIFLSILGYIGTDRIDYIFLLFLLYYTPLLYCLVKYFNFNGDKLFNILLLTLCVFYTPFIIPTLKGYPDIAGLLPILATLILCNKYTPIDKLYIKHMILIGIVIYLSFLIRRWYAYTIASFYFSLFITNIIFSKNKENILFLFYNICIACFCTLLCVLMFQGGLVVEILKSNYYYNYSAFDYGFIENIVRLLDCLPYSVFILTFISILYIIYKRDRFGILLIVFLFLDIILHASMQRFDVQHRLPIFFLTILIFVRSLLIVANKKIIYCTLFIGIAINSINYTSTLFKNFNIRFITQSEKFYPVCHENYKELIRLLDTISNLPDIDKVKISFFVSSHLLCDDMAETVLGDKIVYTSHADTRDGIPISSLLTGYVVATDNTQTHLGEFNQFVIKVPNEQIYNKIGIGKFYKLIEGPFAIGKSCNAYIYKKIKIFDNDAIKKYLNAFPKESSKWPNKVTDDAVKKLTSILY